MPADVKMMVAVSIKGSQTMLNETGAWVAFNWITKMHFLYKLILFVRKLSYYNRWTQTTFFR